MDPETLQISSQNHQLGSGLLRFRSAPSSLLGNFTNTGSAPKLSDSYGSIGGDVVGVFSSQRFQDLEGEATMNQRSNQSNGYVLHPQLPPHYPRPSPVARGNSTCSILSRQSSSPPGIFNHLTLQDGYAPITVRGVSSGEVSSSATALESQATYSSGLPSSLGLLSQISELGSGSHDAGKLENGVADNGFYSPGFAYGPWSESAQYPDTYTVVKKDPDDDGKLFSQTEGLSERTHILSRHLSLLKTPVEMAALDKFAQFQDSVPCKVRAKRGCATHPRSIAERVRRSRISERMRKLQELVPNMEKQTNTADMLDLAVEYIKDLQRQFKTLCDHRAKCKCSCLQKSISSQII